MLDYNSAAYAFTGSATTAVAPGFSPVAGSYTEAQNVTLTSPTAGANIYYMLDGTTPTAKSTLYVSTIPVKSSMTISAIAIAANYTNSSVATAKYSIQTAATAPSFSPTAGKYTGTQHVTLATSTPGATIYYTLNGTTPTTASAKYTGAIAVSSNTTIEAIATAEGYSDSAVAVGAYTITQASHSQERPTAGR